MKHFFNINIFILVAGIILCNACSSNTQDAKSDLGHVKHYKKFLWCDYDEQNSCLPQQKLKITMGELGRKAPVRLQVVYHTDEDVDYKPVHNILIVKKDNRSIPANIFGTTLVEILPTEKECTLDFQFKEGACVPEGKLYISLLVESPGDLDLLNGEIPHKGSTVAQCEWEVEYEEVTNPLKVGFIWLCIIIAALLVLWFALLRWIIFPSFAFDNLQVTYFEGESRKGREDCTLHGARKIICSKSPKYQSGLNKLFCGRIEYLTNPFWETTVVMTPCGSDGISVNEDLKAGNAATYRMTAMITAQNGPRRPFVVKRTKSEQVANISIG